MKILNIEKVYRGFLTIMKLKVETSKGDIVSREVMSRSGGAKSDDSVSSLVYDTERKKYIFAKQFRPGLMNEDDQHLIEVVAGTLEVGEDPEICMGREIEEEIGYKVDKIENVGVAYVSPGGTTEKIHLFVSLVSEKISDGGGLVTEHEEIEIVEMSIDEVKEYNFLDIKTKLLITQIHTSDLLK